MSLSIAQDYRTILITGGAGFVGGNLAVSFKKKYPSTKVIALDNLKRRGSELNLRRLKEAGVEFIHGDIRNREDLEFDRKIDLLIESSAEPSVLAGYGDNPAYIINTNLIGTINCLELARKDKADVIFLSTSRVYPYDALNSIKIVEKDARFEWDKIQDRDITGWSINGIGEDFTLDGPRSMYGATKLCSEIVFREYMSMYGIRGVINRCGIIAGPWQFGKVDQGVFTYWMFAHYFKRPLKYINFGGKGKQVRDLLHIDDFFDLIDREIYSIDKINGRTFNIGGGKDISLSLMETTQLCEKITANKVVIKTGGEKRPADVAVYITDNKTTQSNLNWKPKKKADEILRDIYKWIKENEHRLQNF